MKNTLIIFGFLVASIVGYSQPYMGSDDLITKTDSVQIDTLDNNIKYDNWVEFVENHSGADPVIIDTLFYERNDSALIIRDTIGTMVNYDHWHGSAAEYSAGTLYEGISPTATNTIAYILNGFNPLLFMLLIMSFFKVSGQAWDSIKVASVDCDSVMQGDIKIWEKPSTDIFVMSMSTESTDSDWNLSFVFTDEILHYEVTGAVELSVDSEFPTFDFSTPGVKNIVVTSYDGDVSDLTDFKPESELTKLDVTGATSLFYLDCSENLLVDLNVYGVTSLGILLCHDNSLTSIDVSTNPLLEALWCHENSLTSLDISNNTELVNLWCQDNSLTTAVVDDIVNYLISLNVDGNNFRWEPQDPTITQNATNLATLKAQGWIIY